MIGLDWIAGVSFGLDWIALRIASDAIMIGLDWDSHSRIGLANGIGLAGLDWDSRMATGFARLDSPRVFTLFVK